MRALDALIPAVLVAVAMLAWWYLDEWIGKRGAMPKLGPKMQEIDDLAKLIEEARKRGPMTDEERREQAASFAFGNLALTKEWADATADELAGLRETCRRMAGCKPLDVVEEWDQSLGRWVPCPTHDQTKDPR